MAPPLLGSQLGDGIAVAGEDDAFEMADRIEPGLAQDPFDRPDEGVLDDLTGRQVDPSLSGGTQRAASLQAACSTRSPSRMIRPPSSARRMNTSGLIGPSWG